MNVKMSSRDSRDILFAAKKIGNFRLERSIIFDIFNYISVYFGGVQFDR